jgi:hypothetical protein
LIIEQLALRLSSNAANIGFVIELFSRIVDENVTAVTQFIQQVSPSFSFLGQGNN